LIALLLWPLAFEERETTRWFAAIGLGLSLGLAILTKVSALVVLAAFGLAGLLQFVRDGVGGIRGRLHRLAPLLTAFAMVALLSGWYFAWCKAQYGKALITGYDAIPGKPFLLGAGKPYWARRPPAYFLGWNLDIYTFPFYPSAALPEARFFPQLIATTFSDYYNYGLAPYPYSDQPARLVGQRPLRLSVVGPAGLSVVAGTVIAAVSAVAWFAAWVWCWRRRAHAMLGLLLVPLLAVAGQAHFSVTIANDAEGLIKGSYLQFAAAPLFALFGLGVDWLGKRRRYASAALVALASMLAVTWYVVYCIFFAR
jgi:hypothetical protein